MRTMTLAKRVWEHACEVHEKAGDKACYESVLHHYYGLLTLYAAAQAADYSNDKEWMDKVVSMLGRYPFEFESPDIYFRYNFDNYRVGGLGKPWLMLKGYFDDEHKEEVRKYAELTMNAPKSHDGILCMPHRPEDELIWIDIAYAVTPYMLFAGLLLDEEKYINFGVEQTFKMYDVFMDHSNGLLHQARGFMYDKTTISHDHWSRGNGWGYLAMAELVRYLPKDSKYYDEAVKRFVAHTEALVKFRDERGIWRQSIAEPLAWLEESGSAIFLYGIGIGIRKGILDKDTYLPILEDGTAALIKLCIKEDGSVDRCCRGCLCVGSGEKKGTVEAYLLDATYKVDDGHAFGPAIMALTEAYKNGIIDIPVR